MYFPYQEIKHSFNTLQRGRTMTNIYFTILVICVVGSESGPQCLSCSGVENVCHHSIECANDEVCYMHHYVTESGEDLIDYGCMSPQACPISYSPIQIIGRRNEGHHIKCTHCCNTKLCNANLSCSSNGNIHSQTLPPMECSDLRITKSGVFSIYPYGTWQQEVRAYCYVDPRMHIWTVIQRRIDGKVNFYRDWQSYKTGFGTPSAEYWLGNDVIHELTEDSNHALMIRLTDYSNVTKYAEYLSFHVASEAQGYRLTVSLFDGNATDDLSYHSGQKFTTHDRDNDPYSSNCAIRYKGAWWYKSCYYSTLNGLYITNPKDNTGTGMAWYNWHGYHPLKETIMMIRRH